uniref:Putative secreted protein n=1 Tax=Anopheles marajoara TaxID=58244 RepID=A0A2M4C934_9DIPT
MSLNPSIAACWPVPSCVLGYCWPSCSANCVPSFGTLHRPHDAHARAHADHVRRSGGIHRRILPSGDCSRTDQSYRYCCYYLVLTDSGSISRRPSSCA